MSVSLRACVALAITTSVLLAACTPDKTVAPESTISASINTQQDPVPERGSETHLPQWSTQPDSILFARATALDTVFAIGIKAPGSRRGFYHGARLVDPTTWTGARAQITARYGVRIVAIDTLLPIIRAKITNVEALAFVRKLPFVDYVEPAYLPSGGLYDDSGCDYPSWSGYSDTSPYGDVQPDSYRMMNIDRAWSVTSGQGIWIGLTDTGVNLYDFGNSEFGSWFATGAISSRQFRQTSTTGTGPSGNVGGVCSHGTRMAGVVAAPMNGRSIVGVAYGANLYSVHANDRVWDSDGVDQQQAIRDAGQWGSRVILMAWGVPFFHQALNDEIDYWYYNRDVLFVGAAGTSAFGQDNVIFPAEKSDVVAVSAANRDGNRMSDSHYGPELDLIAYVNQPTTTPTAAITSISSSSNATGVVGGVAALVRAQFPSWTNAQVTNRMIQMSDTTCGMPQAFHRLINAAAAVSGFCVSNMYGPTAIGVGGTTEESQSVTIWYSVQVRNGVGPYSYRWVGSNSTGPSAPITFYSYGGAGGYRTASVTVSITDEGSSLPPALRTETRNLFISVNDRGYWDPDTCAPPHPC